MNNDILKAQDVSSRELFHAACAGVPCNRPPFWIMRQAGRYLPEYRKLKEKHGFLEIVKTPELSVEAALQPIRRFDFDAAILFSDILVISEALGFPYSFADGGGIKLEKFVQTEDDVKIAEENAGSVCERLRYVSESLRGLRKALPNKAVLGFAGSPWTIACYMLSGGGADAYGRFPKAENFAAEKPELFERLMAALTKAVGDYATMQLVCGIDGFQIFDSHGYTLKSGDYGNMSGTYMEEIFKKRLDGRTRGIAYVPKMSARFDEIAALGAEVFSLDAEIPLSKIYADWHFAYSLQGNVPNSILETGTPADVERAVRNCIADMQKNSHHILNLSGGITPRAKLENVEAFVRTAKSFEL